MTDKFNDEYDNQDLDFLEEDDYEVEDYQEFVLTLEDDTEVNCLVLAEYSIEDQAYIALLPMDEEDERGHGDILLYRSNSKEDGTFDVELIESEEEFEMAAEAYYHFVGIDEFELEHDCDCEECSGHHHHHHHHHHSDDHSTHCHCDCDDCQEVEDCDCDCDDCKDHSHCEDDCSGHQE